MTEYIQTYEGGAIGATAGGTANTALGSRVWRAGTGTAVYTDQNVIHGTTSVNVANSAGSVSQSQVLDLNDTEINAQAYVRVPTTMPSAGSVTLMGVMCSNNTEALQIGVTSDGYLVLSTRRTEVKRSASKDASLGGKVFRLAIRAKIGSDGTTTAYWAVFDGESDVPVLEATSTVAGITSADTFSNVQWGVVNTSDAQTVMTVMVDSIRALTGVDSAASWLAPVGVPKDYAVIKHKQVWWFDGVDWRQVGGPGFFTVAAGTRVSPLRIGGGGYVTSVSVADDGSLAVSTDTAGAFIMKGV